MDRFAFVFHPHDITSLGDWVLLEPNLKLKRRRTAERALRWFPPFKRETVTGIKSLLGKEIEGDMILWPMIPEQILKMDSKFTTGKLIDAGKLAQDMGAKIIGLGAFAASIGQRGKALSRAVDIAVTTGTSYTIITVVKAIFKAAKEVGISVERSRVSVIGATGAIGSVTAQLIAKYVSQLNLVARNWFRLEALKELIMNSQKVPPVLKIFDNIKNALKVSDIVVIATNAINVLIDIDDVLPGTVICDISLPHNITKEDAEKRSDVLVIDGGVVRPPGNCDFHFNFGLLPGLAYACMAETMILTLEGLFENYSIGGRIPIERIEKIERMGNKHGFVLADFKSFGKKMSKSKIDIVRKVVKKK